MVFDHQIPTELKSLDQWVAWTEEPRDGKPTKVPIDPGTGAYASVSDAGTWHGFADTLQYYRETDAVDGLGFVFVEDRPYAGVDLDDCRDPDTETVDEWAIEIMHRLDSYTERSPSGTGYHVIVIGEVPDGGNRGGDVELYDSHRYFTVTGDHVAGTPTTVEDRADALRAVHDAYIADTDRDTGTAPAADCGDVALTDDELIRRAKHAANGDKFQALWNGDTSGYPSHSEADQALCAMLAFWTGGDPQRIETLFEKSGLVRDKWRDRPDYRERTIRKAIQTCTAFYDPEASSSAGGREGSSS